MGKPFFELIPAAILLDNPGLTQDEFIKQLNDTKASQMFELSASHPWNAVEDEWEMENFHRGLHGLAEILDLPKTKNFEQTQKRTFDKNNIPFAPLQLSINAYKIKETWMTPTYAVFENTRNILEEFSQTKSFTSREKLRPGDFDMCYSEGELIEEILEEDYEKGDWADDGKFRYKAKRRHIERVIIKNKFGTLGDLVKKFPQFNPEFMYDFSQQKGEFKPDDIHNHGKGFFWKQQNNKYYLDEEKTFNNAIASIYTQHMLSPHSEERLRYGYTDLMLTAEVIKNKAWKVFSRNGDLKFFSAFFDAFPSSKERYDKAVWDAHTFLYAKKKNMTINETLRFRISPGTHNP